MDNARLPSRSHLFTLRMWREDLGHSQTEWRGEVHEVVSGEIRYFREWPTLVAIVQAMLAEQEGSELPER